MRESEMRQRIDGFLKRRMQGMLAPALGMGLALGGCGKTTATPIYSAPNPDGDIGHTGDAVGSHGDVPVYSAPVPPDAALADAFAGKDTSSGDRAFAPDLATVADVAAPADGAMGEAGHVVDAAKDLAGEGGSSSEARPGVDAGESADGAADVGSMTTKYMAQLPDAAPDRGPMTLYMAPLPLG